MSNYSRLSYIVDLIPGKGLGLRATRHILRGERIMEDDPLYVVYTNRNRATFETEEISEITNDILTAVKDQNIPLFQEHRPHGRTTREGRFRDLAITTQRMQNARRSTSPRHTDAQREDIFRFFTNALVFSVPRTDARNPAPQQAYMVLDTISRVNHSCRPNATVQWNTALDSHSNLPVRGRATLHALRDLAAREEITIAYSRDYYTQTRNVRQACLSELYEFTCSCPVCSDFEAIAISDKYREGIRQMILIATPKHHTNEPLTPAEQTAARQASATLVDLLLSERIIDITLGQAAHVAGRLFERFDSCAADHYLQIARENNRCCYGMDNPVSRLNNNSSK